MQQSRINQPELPWTPTSDEDADTVREQLERILAHSHFKGSKRYTRFLRYIVEDTLSGKSGRIKERSLGVAVFDRPADYDTNSDSIVRVAASEVRKRLAQYYDTPRRHHELRIELPLGSYTPEFLLPRYPDAVSTNISQHEPSPTNRPDRTPINEVDPEPERLPSASPRPYLFRPYVWLPSLFCIAVLALGSMLWAPSKQKAIFALWGPMVERKESVLICVGQVSAQNPHPTSESGQMVSPIETRFSPNSMLLPDAASATKVSAVLGRLGANPQLLGTAGTNLTDLQATPGVFIGAFNNPWTLRLRTPLRYQLVRNSTDQKYGIIDIQHPKLRIYQIDKSKPYDEFTQDYGIVARFLSPTTEQETVIIAGIGANGTLAAASMASDERFLGEFVHSTGKDAIAKNFEILVATQIIDNRTGLSKVLDVQFW